MKRANIKKYGILTFALTNGVLGGLVSLTGKMFNNKFLDSLGEDIVDSSIFTGELVGDAIGGVNDVIAGKIKEDPERLADGAKILKGFAKDSVRNIASNLVLIADTGEEAVVSLIDKENQKAYRAIKTLGKVLIIGTLTGGAIKVDREK